jgi:Tetratrico peptide repeat
VLRRGVGLATHVAKYLGRVDVRCGNRGFDGGWSVCQRVPMSDAEWERRMSDAWTSIDQLSEAEFLALIESLAAELPPDSPVGVFERAGALDSTGHSDLAVPLYQKALDLGLTGGRRRRAVIQMASSLRNLGRAAESVALLTNELNGGSDELDGAVRAFLALSLADVGREREAVSVAIAALVPHLPRYQRSLANYARLLVEDEPDRQEQE